MSRMSCARDVRGALRSDARGGGGLPQLGHLGPPRLERAIRRAQADEILPMLLGAMTINRGDGGNHAIRAADLLQIGDIEEQAHVAGTSQLVQLDHARFEQRPRRLGLFLELRDLIAGIAELAADLLRVRFNLSELLRPQIALDFETPKIAEQRALLPRERIGLALQCDEPFVCSPGLRLRPRAIGRLRDERGCARHERMTERARQWAIGQGPSAMVCHGRRLLATEMSKVTHDCEHVHSIGSLTGDRPATDRP